MFKKIKDHDFDGDAVADVFEFENDADILAVVTIAAGSRKSNKVDVINFLRKGEVLGLIMREEPDSPWKLFISGDVNNDGKIDEEDTKLLLQLKDEILSQF